MVQPHDGSTNIHPDLWQPGPDATDVGRITVRSGKVVVCDAGVLDMGVEVTLPNGDYLVRVTTGPHRTHVSASLLADGALPVSFEKVGSYGVDAGLSGFFDHELHTRAQAHEFESDIYNDLIDGYLYPESGDDLRATLVPFEGSMFSAARSGGGDGIYPVFTGRDADGKIVAVITTF